MSIPGGKPDKPGPTAIIVDRNKHGGDCSVMANVDGIVEARTDGIKHED